MITEKELELIRTHLAPDQDVPHRDTSKKKTLFWKGVCDHNHSFSRSIRQFLVSPRCPYCNGRRVLQGFNDVATTYPEILDHWCFDKNKELGLSPYVLSAGSGKKVWMQCNEGHSWMTAVHNYVSGYRCPYCYNRAAPGVNDLATVYPELVARHWDFERNTVSPSEVKPGSDVEAYWLCSKGHSYTNKIQVRIRKPDYDVCPYCSGRKLLQGFNDLLTLYPEVAEEFDAEKNNMLPHQVIAHSRDRFHFVCPEGHHYETVLLYRTYAGSGCPTCAKSRSKLEVSVYEEVKSILPDDVVVEHNYRDIKGVTEVDIYVPSLNIAIEVNGVYWHSDAGSVTARTRHYGKWSACKDNGIQLITVWEDDWTDRRDVVVSMLRHKLGVSSGRKVFARKTEIRQINYVTAAEFLDSNHIQGAVTGSVYYGLFTGEEDLVSVSVWRKSKDVLYLDRYATSCIVIGGAGKMLKAGKQYGISRGCTSIVSFSDNEVSDGSLYERLGFSQDKFLKPDYEYIYKNKRYHKFNFRKKRFRDDPQLDFQDGLTEWQLAELNGLVRVYDCGKIRWKIDLNT